MMGSKSIAVSIMLLILGVSYVSVSNADELGENNQSNYSNTNSYGTMSNYMVNNNSDTYHRVGSVQCATPSVDFGLAGPKGLGNDAMAHMSFNVPLDTGLCKDAQRQELGMAKYRLHVEKVEQKKRDLLFQEKMSQVCLELHKTTLINDPENILFKECQSFSFTHGHPHRGDRERRVSTH